MRPQLCATFETLQWKRYSYLLNIFSVPTCVAHNPKFCFSVDCSDIDDEFNCNATGAHHYQVSHLMQHKRTLNATSFLIFWYMPSIYGQQQIHFEYLPSISLADTKDTWTNHTAWIENTEHRFANLTPYTTYNVTVYAREKNSKTIDPPYLYLNVTTAEGNPTEPLNVFVSQLNGSRVQVSWDPPKEPYGILKEYTVYYRSQSINVQQPHSVKVSPHEHSIILESHFEPNTTYEYWVRARNSKYESSNSNLVRLSFDDTSNVDRLAGLHVTHIGVDFIRIEWTAIIGVDGYVIQPR